MCTQCGCDGNHKPPPHGLSPHVQASDPHGLAAVGVQLAGIGQERLIRIEQDVLGSNDAQAHLNRACFRQNGILALNLLSSPGSGKTSLLERTLSALQPELTFAVVEGDQQTSRDAERIRATGVNALQINTGKGCHLDAQQISRAITELGLARQSVLFIENVGNLVCPALFDLGEEGKVVVLSVTEGEDKPLKYPDMFRRAALVILNKTDLLPHLDFDLAACVDHIRKVNPHADILPLSVRTGEGMEAWYDWLRNRHSGVARLAD